MSVFITGASSGIGEACARAFAAAGKDLVLTARRLDRLFHLRDELKKAYPQIQVHCYSLDVTQRSSLDDLMSQHREVFQGVDVLINNAGLALGRDPIQKGSPQDWDVVIDTNLKGLLYVTHAFLPIFLARKSGHIVNVSSVAGLWVYPNGNVYCASKHAVQALTQSLRYDLNGSGIRVTEISPGMVQTEFSKVRFKGDEKKAAAVYEGKTPLQPVDIAETIIWCVNRPAHVNIQEVVLFPTEQPGVL